MDQNKYSYQNHLVYSQSNSKVPQTTVPLGVLVGKIGVGKSSLFNKITGNNVSSEEGCESVTRKVFSSSSCFGANFQILDTPGTQSDVDKLLHAVCLRTALTQSPISRIFVLVQYKPRPSLIAQELMEFLEFLSEWKFLITTVVTYWDKDDNPKNREICQTVQKTLLQTCQIPDSFIFTGDNSKNNQLCNAFYEQLCLSSPIKLEIDNKYFVKKFDIFDKMDKQISEYTTLFQTIIEEMSKEIISYNDDSTKDEFYHACIVQIKQISEEMIEDFSNQYGKNMNEYDCYYHFLQLKREFIPGIEKIRVVAQGLMSYNLLDSSDPKNNIKKCPNCSEIWVKVVGCDGVTTCGKRPNMDEGVIDNIKGAGCGKQLNWGSLPALSNHELQELKDAGVCDILYGSENKGRNQFETELERLNNEEKINKI